MCINRIGTERSGGEQEDGIGGGRWGRGQPCREEKREIIEKGNTENLNTVCCK